MDISKEKEKRLKEIELSLLKEFILVCEKLGLEYFAVGGTLLGAVRHKGFIPWDDDIDVGMKRSDFEIFKKKAQELMPDNIFVQHIDSEKDCPYNFIKLRDNNTTFIETSVCKLDINHGVFIDVFPLDNYPVNKKERKSIYLKNTLLTASINRIFHIQGVSLFGKFLELVSRIIYPDVRKALITRDRLYKKYQYDKSPLIINYCGAWGKKEIVNAEWFEETLKMDFEDIKISIPKDYEQYLTNLYGEYMCLPPIEKRQSHHFTEIIDLEKSYKNYMHAKKL